MKIKLLCLAVTIISTINISYADVETNATTVASEEESSETNSLPSLLDATASKLIKYRRKPPPGYYRYKIYPYKRTRSRIKTPNVKYAPNLVTYPKPDRYNSNYYPDIYSSTLAYKPSYIHDEVQYQVSSEYPVVESDSLSDMDWKGMDHEFSPSTYAKKKAHSQGYSKSHKTFIQPQRIHKTYSSPEQPPYNSYHIYDFTEHNGKNTVKPEIHYEISYHEDPSQDESDDYDTLEQLIKKGYPEGKSPYVTPNTQNESPINIEEQSSYEEPYPIYNKKLPNADVRYNKPNPRPSNDIHITYAPPYEENPFQPQGVRPTLDYDSPKELLEAPQYNSEPNEQNFNQGQQYTPDNTQPGGHYAEPPVYQEKDLPLSTNHMPAGYDFPKNSYQVPIYQMTPFRKPAQGDEYFPPNHDILKPGFEEPSESNRHVHKIISSQSPSVEPTISSFDIPPSDEEPHVSSNIKVHTFRSKQANHIRKSKPISNSQLLETPSTKDHSYPRYSSPNSVRYRHKQKRIKPTVAGSYNLDAPELQDAYKTHSKSPETFSSSSGIPENFAVESDVSITTPTAQSEFTPSVWNPMKIRTKPPNTSKNVRIPYNSRKEIENVEVLSIQKSRSHSYYAGTIPPHKRSEETDGNQPDTTTLRSSSYRANDTEHTMKHPSIDSTFFKVGNDRDNVYDGTGELPKNHKLF